MARIGIDLSGDSIALADVRQAGARLQLRGYALLDPIPDRAALTEALRRVRDEHRFPANAEVVAWAGEPRVSAVRAAGYAIERVILPGEALARVARLHRGLAAQPSSDVIALVSLDATSGAMAVVRDATVLYEAPLTWSPNAAPGSATAKGADLLRRYAFLFEVTELLHAALGSVQRSHGAKVSRIVTCGSLPDLRSLTMPLAEEFDVEIETLDSAAELDLRRLKGHTREDAQAAVPALQIAMVASRRWHTAHSPMKQLLRIAVPIGVAAAAYGIYAVGFPDSFGPAGTPLPSGPPGSSGSSGSSAAPGPAVPKGVAGSATEGLSGSSRAEATVGAGQATPADPSNRANRSTPSNAPAPVSLSLTSILWSADRRLAIVEGQVLGVGDSIAGMKIVEIQPDRVILRDRAGRLRRAELRRPRPGGSE
jgi:hypothetical protein